MSRAPWLAKRQLTTAAARPKDADHAEAERELIAFVKHDCPVCDQVWVAGATSRK